MLRLTLLRDDVRFPINSVTAASESRERPVGFRLRNQLLHRYNECALSTKVTLRKVVVRACGPLGNIVT